MRTSEIRQKFVEYYETENYQVLPRAPMLDDSIPMSFVMSAGLVQVEQSLAKMQVRGKDRFVLVQDCFRHFDLERVGRDDVHLSFFKMPGAFKFGSNGKVETIKRMWHLATSILGLDRRNLWVSYFVGGAIQGAEFHEDFVVRQAWKEVGLPEDRIIGLGAEDNFWLQGDGFNGGELTRKCGPNTELFYDRGTDRTCSFACQPGCKCGRFIEFSNSLFIRYELLKESGHFVPLVDPFSETVIGIERVAMILQNKGSVFEIDCYQPVLNFVHKCVKKESVESVQIKQCERIIVDHLIALFLLIRDGAPPPGKNGRERIIKLLIRRVVTQQILLGITSSNFLPDVLDCISETILSDRDNLTKGKVIEYFSVERARFLLTIDKGHQQLLKFIEDNNSNILSGEQIVFLEKRKGFPPTLTEKLLNENGQIFPKVDYRTALNIWREQSQN